MILVDFSNTFISSVLAYAGYNGENEITEDICRHLALNSMVSYKKKFGDTYGDLVICCDGMYSWRKKIFPYYKASRKSAKEDSNINWTELLKNMNLLIDEFKANLPYAILKVNEAEGDDCIAVLAAEYPGLHMIISNDKDFGQLQKYPGISQYSPRRDSEIRVDDPIAYLKDHIIHGDAGDGVPNILSDGDTFVNPDKRQKSIMKTKLANWMHQDYSEFVDDEEKIKRNIAMIDFESIPENIKRNILDEYEAYLEGPKVQKRHLINYFSDKKLRAMIDQISHF